MSRDDVERLTFAVAKRLRAGIDNTNLSVEANEHAHGYGTVSIVDSTLGDRLWMACCTSDPTRILTALEADSSKMRQPREQIHAVFSRRERGTNGIDVTIRLEHLDELRWLARVVDGVPYSFGHCSYCATVITMKLDDFVEIVADALNNESR